MTCNLKLTHNKLLNKLVFLSLLKSSHVMALLLLLQLDKLGKFIFSDIPKLLLNWKAQSKNDPLIFRPFLKVFRSSCQLLLNTFKNGRKIKGSFLLWALQLSLNVLSDILAKLPSLMNIITLFSIEFFRIFFSYFGFWGLFILEHN